ncbi:unnamed protein product [Adineta steineri]|uniref:Peptidase metallopeptidase domain-containing protein n=2 Tax=Adineta steineri TaxID=433720 RepID=A0A818IP09_9BILA|nr:unnamed protein product [Adineta steineri]
MQHIIYIIYFILIHNIQIIISSKSEVDSYRYLQQFGYTSKLESRLFSSIAAKSSVNDGIKKFQRLFKLPETGELDARTKKFMERARCGNPDLGSVETVGRPVNLDKASTSVSTKGRSTNVKAPASYEAQSIIWPKKHLKWYIEEYPKKQKLITSQDHTRRIINQAFQDWEKYSGLTFEMLNKKEGADLIIKFRSNDHGDGYPFDGQGATLAHAFYPKSGDIHFDDDEIFTDDYSEKDEQYTLRLVAAHEIGHALGLAHSFETNSLMFPVYQQFQSDYVISHDDQQGIQTLYGKPGSETTIKPIKTTTKSSIVTTHSTNILPANNWCSEDFQTGCEGPDNNLYLFKDNLAWRYNTKGKRSWDPHPKLINTFFPTLNDTTITACVKSATGYTYLFRNYRLWKLPNHWSVDGPHIIYGHHYPQNPRAALFHQNSIYLIRNRLIYRLNEFDYHKDLEILTIDKILKPPPSEYIHSGFTYKKQHIIFTKHHVYVYDATTGNLNSGYPKSKINGWFACDGASQAPHLKKKTTTTTTKRTTTMAHRRDQERDDYHHRHREDDHHHHREDDHHHHRQDDHHHHHREDDHHHHEHGRPPPKRPHHYHRDE